MLELVRLVLATLVTNVRSWPRASSLPRRWVAWLAVAVAEEEAELSHAIRPHRGRPLDALVASVSLVVVVESISDPVSGQGWYDDANSEIGDICAWKTRQLGGYMVQPDWSNSANACR